MLSPPQDYDAEQLLTSVSSDMHERLGTDNWEVGVIYGRLASFYARKGNYGKYEKAAKTAAECRIASSAASHSQVRFLHGRAVVSPGQAGRLEHYLGVPGTATDRHSHPLA